MRDCAFLFIRDGALNKKPNQNENLFFLYYIMEEDSSRRPNQFKINSKSNIFSAPLIS